MLSHGGNIMLETRHFSDTIHVRHQNRSCAKEQPVTVYLLQPDELYANATSLRRVFSRRELGDVCSGIALLDKFGDEFPDYAKQMSAYRIQLQDTHGIIQQIIGPAYCLRTTTGNELAQTSASTVYVKVQPTRTIQPVRVELDQFI